MRHLFLLFAFFGLTGSGSALTLEELIAIHDARSEPYALRSFPIDDDLRASWAEQTTFEAPEVREGALAALASRFDGAVIHVFRQTDTSLVSHIVGLEMDGQIVLLNIHSVAFFEIPELVQRRMALFDAVLLEFDASRFEPGWTEAAFQAAIDAGHAYHDGDRNGPYPGWSHSTDGTVQTLSIAAIPDWIDVTVTTLADCPPRYPAQGWGLIFLCTGD